METKRVYKQVGVAMTSRSYVEYEKMFMLESHALVGKRVLDVAGGASSFTMEARQLGIEAEAVDPLYAKSSTEIAEHGIQEIEVIAAKMAKLTDTYDWTFYGSAQQHKASRITALQRFIEDFSSTERSSRYHIAALPYLPFADESFDFVCCSHFLFLYEEQFDYAFHLAAVKELLRVCKRRGEVRLYPILNFRTVEYSHLKDLISELEFEGFDVEKREASLPFLPNSHQFLNIMK